MTYYILDGHTPVAADLMTWAREHTIDKRRVAETTVDDSTWVSTVFLGTDHRFTSDGPPVLFETMVFHDGDGQECWRYCTWDAAQAGHEQVVAAIRAGSPLGDVDPPSGGES